MADEKDPKKQSAEDTGKAEDKPKRTRSAGTRKGSESTEKKPARRRPQAKAKAEDKAEGEKAASKPRRRTPARAKKDDAPKPEAKSRAAPKAESKAEPKPKAEETKEAESKAPARRRAARPAAEPKAGRPAPVRPVVTAHAKYVRSSARKARLVIDHVRGKPIGEARALLRHSPRGIARDLERLLESAIANAENNHDLIGDDLYVKEIYADEGPTLKRFRARAQGRAYRIRKRTSHLTVALTPKE
jgi:ribosomal protein L22